MRPVAVRIFHPEAAPGSGPLERWVARARRTAAERHVAGFLEAGAVDARIVSGPPDGRPFGRRLRAAIRDRPAGLVALGSGAIPLATARDRRDLVTAAASTERVALTNNRHSADVVAIARATEGLAGLPDLAGDNELPRWLAAVAGYAVADLRSRWRLGVDLDGPLDLLLIGVEDADPEGDPGLDRGRVRARLGALRALADDPGAELLVAGRTSAATLRWLETATRSRTRAFVEERGLRTRSPGQRPPASILGLLLDRDGPASVGSHLARLADAAVVDTRVLLAHRLGPDPHDWPVAEDRFASDLLLHERITDPWLRTLTAAAADGPIPIVLGGHTLVGPALRLALGGRGRPGRGSTPARERAWT